MKIIFLDVDGVLNSEELCHQWKEKGEKGYGGFFEEGDVATDENVKWGQNMVDNLKRIVDSTGAKIVISSTWRKFFSVEKFQEMFRVYGWEDAPVIDKTQLTRSSRGWEVNTWLNKNLRVKDYVIIDDYPDFYASQLSRFVETNPDVGLTSEDADKAIKILNDGIQPILG